jgi:hypothetical protein
MPDQEDDQTNPYQAYDDYDANNPTPPPGQGLGKYAKAGIGVLASGLQGFMGAGAQGNPAHNGQGQMTPAGTPQRQGGYQALGQSLGQLAGNLMTPKVGAGNPADATLTSPPPGPTPVAAPQVNYAPPLAPQGPGDAAPQPLAQGGAVNASNPAAEAYASLAAQRQFATPMARGGQDQGFAGVQPRPQPQNQAQAGGQGQQRYQPMGGWGGGQQPQQPQSPVGGNQGGQMPYRPQGGVTNQASPFQMGIPSGAPASAPTSQMQPQGGLSLQGAGGNGGNGGQQYQLAQGYQPYRPAQGQGPGQQAFQNSPMGRQQYQGFQQPNQSGPLTSMNGNGPMGNPSMNNPAPMARGGIVDGGIPGLKAPQAEAADRRYSPIGPRNPTVMISPSPEDMAHRLPRRMSLSPKLNVKLPRPKMPGMGGVKIG